MRSNLIWWGAEEEARPGIIIKSGAVFAAMEAIAGQAIVAQQVEGPATHQGQVLGRMVFPGSAGIPAKVHVQDPMLWVFDSPMAADGGCKPVAIRERAQEIMAFCAGLVVDAAGGLDPPNRLESGPVRFRLQPVDPVAESVATDFAPTAAFSTVSRTGSRPQATSASSYSRVSSHKVGWLSLRVRM